MTEEIHRNGIEPTMIKVGGAKAFEHTTVRVTIDIMPRKGQSTSDIDLATASYVHAQEMFALLDELATDGMDEARLEAIEELVSNIKDYW